MNTATWLFTNHHFKLVHSVFFGLVFLTLLNSRSSPPSLSAANGRRHPNSHRHLLTSAGGAMSLRRSPSPSPCCGDSHFVLLVPVLLVILHSLLLLPHSSLAIRPIESDQIELANATESNVSLSRPREGSFADIIDRALEHEFTENDQNEGTGFWILGFSALAVQFFLFAFHFRFRYWETEFVVSVYSTRAFVGFWFLIYGHKPLLSAWFIQIQVTSTLLLHFMILFIFWLLF